MKTKYNFREEMNYPQPTASDGVFSLLIYKIPYSDENIGFFHMCVEVDDIKEAWKRIVDTGAPQDDAPKQGVDYNWQCWTHDPDGNKVELMQLSEDSPHKEFLRNL